MAVSPPLAFVETARRLREEVDRALSAELECSTHCPSRLNEGMAYAVLGPGKRLRPLLVLLAAEACGGSRDAAMPAAVAVELVHAYSLVHDDLPAMDDDDLRRGRPTCHRAFDEATAILVGDALLTRAFEVLATGVHPTSIAADCVAILAQAVGAEGMVGGQMLDLLASSSTAGHKEWANQEELEAIHRSKTGALFVASLRIGGVLSSASDADLAALVAYGEKIGLAFQIVDDLLDVAGQESQLGKHVGKDDALGKLTFPGLLGIPQSEQCVKDLLRQGCADLEPFGSRGAILCEFAKYLGERNA